MTELEIDQLKNSKEAISVCKDGISKINQEIGVLEYQRAEYEREMERHINNVKAIFVLTE